MFAFTLVVHGLINRWARLARRWPAVGKVWPFIRSQPGLWMNGHIIFLYHHPKQSGAKTVRLRC